MITTAAEDVTPLKKNQEKNQPMKHLWKALIFSLVLLLAVPVFAQEETGTAVPAETLTEGVTENAEITTTSDGTEATDTSRPDADTENNDTENQDTEDPNTEEPEKPKRYSVEIAEKDGTFTPVSDFLTVSEAVTAARAHDSLQAVVRDAVRTRGNGVIFMKEGIAVTAPDHIGKILLHFGSDHGSYTGTGYDALYVEGDGVNVTIQLMGMKGAVQKQGDTNPVDQVELIPRVQITAQSYYQNYGGELQHIIQQFSYSEATNRYTATPHTLSLGPAPSFLDKTTRYYSYDAYRFYRDVFSGSPVGSFEPYFKTLPIRSLTEYTAEELDKYIASWNLPQSKLNNTGIYFKRAQNKTGVNAALLLSMAAHESAKGTSKIALDKNNFFGVNATDHNPYGNADTFHSVLDSILYQAQVKMNDQYLNPYDATRYRGPHLGDKDSGLNVMYASDPYWGEKIAGHMYRLDNFLGKKDSNKYSVGWVSAPANAYAPAGWSDEPAYPLHQGSGYPGSIPVIITGQADAYYIARGIMPLSGKEGTISEPYRTEHVVHIAKKDIPNFSGTIKNPVEPKPETFVLPDRLEGETRIETALTISRRTFQSAKTAVIANGYREIDALTSAPLAGFFRAPILLVNDKEISDAVMKELVRLGVEDVLIVGGDVAVSGEIETRLKDKYKVTRLSGENRNETAVEVFKHLKEQNPNETRVFLANGVTAADAMSIGGYAAKQRIPILLTYGTELTEGTKAAISKTTRVTLLGGENAISKNLSNEILEMRKQVERIYGENRHETSVEIAEKYYGKPQNVILTRGDQMADGLAGSTLASVTDAPILLVNKGRTSAAGEYLKKIPVETVFVLGGENAVSAETVIQVLETLGE